MNTGKALRYNQKMEGWMEEWLDGWRNGWTDGGMDENYIAFNDTNSFAVFNN